MERPSTLATDGGELCEAGKWCGAGVSAGSDCLEGTYSDARGLTLASECHNCPHGYMCETQGMLAADLVACTEDYYCELGVDNASTNKQDCPKGKYCVTGSAEAVPCVRGEYNDQEL